MNYGCIFFLFSVRPAEGPRVQGDDQVDGAGPAEVRRLPEPENVPSETVRRRVPGTRRVRPRAEHHGQGGVPVPEPRGGTRQAGRRGARRRPLGTCPPAVLGHGRQLRAQRVRGRRMDRQVHVPEARGLTTAAAVNRSGPAATAVAVVAADAAAAAAPVAAGRPRIGGRTVNVTFFFFCRGVHTTRHRSAHYTHVKLHTHKQYTQKNTRRL